MIARVDFSFDVPYVAGSSTSGTVVYIDRNFQRYIEAGGKSYDTVPFLVTHEVVEKSLTRRGVHYLAAHNTATRLELAAVQAAGVPIGPYMDLMQREIEEDETEDLELVPFDLDLLPYEEENDQKVLASINAAWERMLKDGKDHMKPVFVGGKAETPSLSDSNT